MRNCRLVVLFLGIALSFSVRAATWSGWRLVEGGGITDAAVSASVFNGSMYLFAKGKDSKLYVNRGKTDGTGWGTWTEVPGGGYTNAAPASATHGSSLFLFAPGIKDRGVYANALTNSTWSGWSRLGTGTTRLGPGATTSGATAWVIAVDDTAKHIWTSGSSGGAFSAWAEVPGGGVTDAPVAAVTSGGKISLFARGVADGRVYVNTYK